MGDVMPAMPAVASRRASRRSRAVAMLLALLSLAALAPAPANADRVVLKKGPPLRGFVSRTDTAVVVNKYRAKSSQMTYGVVTIPMDQVKRVDEEDVPPEIVRRRREDLAAKDVAGRVGLAKYAVAQKAAREADRVLEEALLLAPENAEALAMYGGEEKFKAFRLANPTLGIRPMLDEFIKARDGVRPGDSGDSMAKRIAESAAGHLPLPSPETFGRVWKSRKEAKGLRRDENLVIRADKNPGA